MTEPDETPGFRWVKEPRLDCLPGVLLGCRAKLHRAEAHLFDLQDRIDAWIETEPHTTRHELDPAGELRLLVEVRHDTGSDWGLYLGDFVHNLRCVLDHLVWQLALAGGVNPDRDHQFPILKEERRFAEATRRQLRGLVEPAVALIASAQPFHRQAPDDHPLAMLAELSNVDKHRVVHPTLVAIDTPNPAEFAATCNEDIAAGHARLEFTSGPLVDGAVVMRVRFKPVGPNPRVHVRGPVPIGLGFGQSGARVAALWEMLDVVAGVLSSAGPLIQTG